METTEKLSVLYRHPTEDDREYWTEVATHITGILGTPGSYKFVAWMLRHNGAVAYYQLGDQARVNLLLKFQSQATLWER